MLFALLAFAAPVEPLSLDDMARAAQRLAPYVARVDVWPAESELILTANRRWQYGVPWSEDLVVVNASLLEEPKRLEVRGPEGVSAATLVRLDLERRVAFLRTEQPLRALGLKPPAPALRPDEGAQIISPLGFGRDATAVSGVLGVARPEFEGFLPSSLKLQLGAPVFDLQLGFVGLSRTVAWDKDPTLLIPPALMAEVFHAADPEPEPVDPTPAPPWWAPTRVSRE